MAVRALAPLLAIALVAGCSDDDGAGGGLSDAQQGAADSAIEQAESIGITLERGCVEDLAGDLSDDDAEAIAAADGGDAALSAEGEELGARLFDCASQESLVDFFLNAVLDAGEFDEACARQVLEAADLAATFDDPDAQADVDEQLQDCVLG